MDIVCSPRFRGHGMVRRAPYFMEMMTMELLLILQVIELPLLLYFIIGTCIDHQEEKAGKLIRYIPIDTDRINKFTSSHRISASELLDRAIENELDQYEPQNVRLFKMKYNGSNEKKWSFLK